jgi:hypothetical protein
MPEMIPRVSARVELVIVHVTVSDGSDRPVSGTIGEFVLLH